MIKSLLVLSLSFTNNSAPITPPNLPIKPVKVGIVAPVKAPEVKSLELFKLPEKIQPLPYIGPTIQGYGNPDNTYAWGNCTWYVANNRAVPDWWGNAATWLPRAQEDGYRTGYEPEVGAIAWFPPGRSLGHVAIVEEVYGDGTILIGEMNVEGLNVFSERIINAYEAEYIY